MSNIAHLFNNDAILNDTKVSQFLKRHFKVMLKHLFIYLFSFAN